MSDQNLQSKHEEGVSGSTSNQEFEEFVLKVSRTTNEVIIHNPRTGKETILKAKVEDESEGQSEARKPLTVEQFREAWNKVNELGITWTTDIPPAPTFTPGRKRDAEFRKEYVALQDRFPNFPRELGSVILHTLLHPVKDRPVDEKSRVISSLLTQSYRSEFFFKYAIKVPYFEDIDWEVVIKASERGVHTMPKIAYALLALTLRKPVDTSLSVEEGANEYREPEFITVAVNEQAIDTLIGKLVDTRTALEKAQRLAESLTELEAEEEESHGQSIS